MRVISQNGLIDVPYEMTAFHIVERMIMMNMMWNTRSGTVIAQYSTTEKAVKSFDRMRDVLCHTPEKTFRFPQEDEV